MMRNAAGDMQPRPFRRRPRITQRPRPLRRGRSKGRPRAQHPVRVLTLLRQHLTELVIALVAVGAAFALDDRIATRQEQAEERRAKQQEILENVRFVRERSGDSASAKPFADIHLPGANLSGLDLGCKEAMATNCADFRAANLRDVLLPLASLAHADLQAADLANARLNDANFTGANLAFADLTSADLSGADLSGANLADAELMGANLIGADLNDANLTGAYLSGADLSGADLTDAQLPWTDLTEAYLGSADLSGADLSGAQLRGANFTDAQLSGADLSGADVTDAIGLPGPIDGGKRTEPLQPPERGD
jgi:uncharacterized protein YjbI with pentapeptide repeats